MTTEPGSKIARADEELRRRGLREEEVEFAGADQLRELREVDHDEGLEDLHDEAVGADEQDHAPFAPARHVVDLQIKELDEREAEREPGKLDDDPEDEVRLEHHLAHGRVADLREPDAGVTGEGGHGVATIPQGTCAGNGTSCTAPRLSQRHSTK